MTAINPQQGCRLLSTLSGQTGPGIGPGSIISSFLTQKEHAKIYVSCLRGQTISRELYYEGPRIQKIERLRAEYLQIKREFAEEETKLNIQPLKAQLEVLKKDRDQSLNREWNLNHELQNHLRTWKGWFVSKINVPTGCLACIGRLFRRIHSIQMEIDEQNRLHQDIQSEANTGNRINQDIQKLEEEIKAKSDLLYQRKGKAKNELQAQLKEINNENRIWNPIITLFGSWKKMESITRELPEEIQLDMDHDMELGKQYEALESLKVDSAIFRGVIDTELQKRAFVAFKMKTVWGTQFQILESDYNMLRFIHEPYAERSLIWKIYNEGLEWSNEKEKMGFRSHVGIPHSEVFFDKYGNVNDEMINRYNNLKKMITSYTTYVRQQSQKAKEASSVAANRQQDEKQYKEKDEKANSALMPVNVGVIPEHLLRPSNFVVDSFGGPEQFQKIPREFKLPRKRRNEFKALKNPTEEEFTSARNDYIYHLHRGGSVHAVKTEYFQITRTHLKSGEQTIFYRGYIHDPILNKPEDGTVRPQETENVTVYRKKFILFINAFNAHFGRADQLGNRFESPIPQAIVRLLQPY